MGRGKKRAKRERRRDAKPAQTPPDQAAPARPRSIRTRVVIIVALLVGLAGVWLLARELVGPSAAPTRNVLLISVDTLRADALGCYGGTGAPTPTIDRLAREGALFKSVTSSAPMTLPSHATMMTGLIPPHHGARLNQGFVMKEDLVVLAELLRDAGYQTAGFVSGVPLQRPSGMAQGFDHFDDDLSTTTAAGGRQEANERDAHAVLSRARAWLERTDPDRPVFAFVHVFDPHEPYKKALPGATGGSYAGEVAYVDQMLGDFLADLEQDPRWAGMLTVLTADHGEALGEHGESTHGFLVYQSTLAVPLILHWPGAIRPARIAEPVGVVDIFPTVLDLLDLPVPQGIDGRSARVLLDGGDASGHETYFECLTSELSCGWAPLRGVRVGSSKYIEAPRPELYDIDRDPQERLNLVDRMPQQASLLAARVAEVGAGRSASAAVDAKTAERLASLGYVGGGSAGQSSGRDLPDPKDRLEAFEQLQAAHRESIAGRTRQALAMLEGIEKQFLNSPYYYERRGGYEMSLGDLDATIASQRRVLELDPTSAQAMLFLGVAHARQQAFDLAYDDFTRLLAEYPDDAQGHLNLALVIQATGRPPGEAVTHFKRFLELAPLHPRAASARAALAKLNTG